MATSLAYLEEQQGGLDQWIRSFGRSEWDRGVLTNMEVSVLYFLTRAGLSGMVAMLLVACDLILPDTSLPPLVGASIHGRVLAADSTPVAGVTLTGSIDLQCPARATAGTWGLPAPVTTDSGGRFRLAPHIPAEWGVRSGCVWIEVYRRTPEFVGLDARSVGPFSFSKRFDSVYVDLVLPPER